jgi:hypothetical protein
MPAAVQPDAVAPFAGDDAEAVVLDLVQPCVAARRLRRFSRQAWRDEAERQGHGPAIGRWRWARQSNARGSGKHVGWLGEALLDVDARRRRDQ